ncbi:hypothetical protein D9600_08850 [Deinococcus sp. DB0503]|nr:hypothetical protein [Deinococcus sp. DB0503]
MVTEQLKAPATAKFDNYYSARDNGNLTGSYVTGYTWNGYVDAENSFGANIRTDFTCTTEAGSDVVHLTGASR